MGVVAAGAVPLSVPAEMQVTQTPRYRQMLADYQLLAREQLICGTQVHVGDRRPRRGGGRRQPGRAVPAELLALSRQLAVLVRRLRHRLRERANPGLAALADDRAGRAVSSAAEYDGWSPTSSPAVSSPTRDGLLRRPPVRAAADLELRVCDRCPSVDTHRADRRACSGRWSNAKSRGVRAGHRRRVDLPDAGPCGAVAGRPVRARGRTVDVTVAGAGPRASRSTDSSRPAPTTGGDRRLGAWSSSWPSAPCIAGSSAARQRRALRRRGRLTDVVDQLIAETAGWRDPAAVGSRPDAAVRLPAAARPRNAGDRLR